MSKAHQQRSWLLNIPRKVSQHVFTCPDKLPAVQWSQSKSWSQGKTHVPRALATSSDTTPPGAVTDFTAIEQNRQVALTWTNPGDGDFAGVRIVRKEGSVPASTSDGTIVYQGPLSGYTDGGVVGDVVGASRVACLRRIGGAAAHQRT